MGRRSKLCALSLMAAVSGLVGACSTSPACPGLSPRQHYLALQPKGNAADAVAIAAASLSQQSIGTVSCWASQGDPMAEFTLGYAFENGLHVPKDIVTAKSLYARAARPKIQSRAFYAAPAGGQRYGTVLTVPASRSEGLEAAKVALSRLEASSQDP